MKRAIARIFYMKFVFLWTTQPDYNQTSQAQHRHSEGHSRIEKRVLMQTLGVA